MTHALFLAVAYLRHHLLRTVILVLATAMIVVMPLMVRAVLDAAERLLATRADATPLVVGAKGSALDVLMNALYFTDDTPGALSMWANEDIWESGYAIAVPVLQRYRAQGFPVVGTTLDYFDMRGLTLDRGRSFAVLGEAVVGANVARRLGLDIGAKITSDPVNLFDLTGSYPLRMPVVGVLAASGSPDDDAVFADLKTVWVIEGLGHGHDDLVDRPEMVLSDAGDNLAANSGLELYAEITPETAAGFHFHGDQGDYPITAVLAFPPDRRAATLLRGRYVLPELDEQIMVPGEVIDDLLSTIFKISRILDAVIVAAALAALIAIALAIFLSWQLRRAEIETIFKLGGRKSTAFRLVACELAIVLSIGIVVAASCIYVVAGNAVDIATWLLVSSA